MIDVALIGFGLAGRAFHAPVISAVPGLRLAAILQRHGNEAASAYPHAVIARNLDELLAIPDIRLIVIATPNDTHFSFAQQCLAAGRDVVVDKPFTTTVAEAIALVQFAQERGRFLTVYQNRRYDGDFQAVRQLVSAGALGSIVRFETNYDRFRPQLRSSAWRETPVAGAGILFDIGPHLIDHAFELFSLPQAISADIRIERRGAVVDDAFDITLFYRAGLRAVLRSTMLAASPRPRFLLHGTQGSYLKQSFDLTEPKLRDGRIPWQEPPTPAEDAENSGTLTLVSSDGSTVQSLLPPGTLDFRDFYSNARDVLLGRAKPAVTLDRALDVMCALELARESSARRCALPWPSS